MCHTFGRPRFVIVSDRRGGKKLSIIGDNWFWCILNYKGSILVIYNIIYIIKIGDIYITFFIFVYTHHGIDKYTHPRGVFLFLSQGCQLGRESIYSIWISKKGITPPKTPTFRGIDSCLMVTKRDFLEMEASLWLNERFQNVAKGRLST